VFKNPKHKWVTCKNEYKFDDTLFTGHCTWLICYNGTTLQRCSNQRKIHLFVLIYSSKTWLLNFCQRNSKRRCYYASITFRFRCV